MDKLPDAGRRPTFTELARRDQLIGVTVEQVGRHGYPATSLSRIAAAAGVSKAAVLYHFPGREALIAAAWGHVVGAMVVAVGEAVEQAGTADAPQAYVRGMVAHFGEHPSHTRLLTESLSGRPGLAGESEQRWGPLAGLIRDARRDRGITAAFDDRSAAIVIGGGIDAILTEAMLDPGYDAGSAAELLVEVIEWRWLVRT